MARTESLDPFLFPLSGKVGVNVGSHDTLRSTIAYLAPSTECLYRVRTVYDPYVIQKLLVSQMSTKSKEDEIQDKVVR